MGNRPRPGTGDLNGRWGRQMFHLFHLHFFSLQLWGSHVVKLQAIQWKKSDLTASNQQKQRRKQKKRKLELKIVKWSHKHYPIKLNTTSKLPTSIPLLQDAHTTIKVLQHFAGCVNLTKGWSFDSRGYWQKAAAQAAVGSNFHSRLGLHKATYPHMSKYIWFR